MFNVSLPRRTLAEDSKIENRGATTRCLSRRAKFHDDRSPNRSSARSDFGYLHLMVGILTLNVVVLIPEIPPMSLAHAYNRGTQIPAANAIVVRLQHLSVRVRSRERS